MLARAAFDLTSVDAFLLQLIHFLLYTPFTLTSPKAIARQPQNPTLENRETDNTGANIALMESFVETPLYKEYCVGKHTHEAKMNSSFVNLLYRIYLLASTNPNCDNVE